MHPVTDVRPAFLLSLPRSGSTLLQRMLGAHPAVSTCAEPWILLPVLAGLNPAGVYAHYNHGVAHRAVDAFTHRLPGGRDAMLARVRGYATGLYTDAAAPGAQVFIDKTPRYGLYIDDLLDAFPDAPMIVLWRNPLAVVASVLTSWLGGRWMPYLHDVDLFELLERLVGAVEHDPGRFHRLRYEDLVASPEAEMRRALAHLGLNWDERVVSGFSATDVRGPVGDRGAGSVGDGGGVSSAATDTWPAAFAGPIRQRWARRYLDWIGPRRLAAMGYDAAQLRQQLSAAPRRSAAVVDDLRLSAKGMAWRIAEPRILADKWAAHRRGDRVVGHG